MASPNMRETAGIFGAAAVGTTQAVGLQALDAAGSLGPAPVPALGGFGTATGLVSLVTGIPAIALGAAGAWGKGPFRNKTTTSAGLVGYGTIVLGAQGLAVALNTPAVKTPIALAGRAQAIAQRASLAQRAAAQQAAAQQAAARGRVMPVGITPLPRGSPASPQGSARLIYPQTGNQSISALYS